MLSEHPGRARLSASGSLLLPVLLTNLGGAALAYGYVEATLGEQVSASLPLLVTLVLLLSGLLVLVGVVLCSTRLRALRQVESGRGPPEPAWLTEAVVEVHRLPDYAFRVSLSMWTLTAVLAGAGVGWLAEVGLPLALRITWPGLLLGPLVALLGQGFVTLRARRVVLWLAARGLTQAQIIAAAPRRSELRTRLVLFVAIATMTPVMLIWDMVSVLAERMLAQVLAEPTPAAQALRAEALRPELLLTGSLLCAFVLGLALAAGFLAGKLLGRPMRELGEEAYHIAEGELGRPRIIPAEDEMWSVSAAFSIMRAHLASVLSQLQRAGARLGATTEEIRLTSSRYEAGAAEQASALDETSTTTEELALSARQIAGNASTVAEVAQRTLAAAKAGQASAESFLATMGRMRHDNQAIAGAVVRLNKRVQQIGKIVGFINGVADKSDLLALNAELEGTKAGEVGQGFSLVAAEMRRLAENVLESTKEIEGLIEEVREASGASVTATEGGVRATETSTALAQQVPESLRQIVELAGRTSDAVHSISRATQQQQAGTDHLAEAMADILRFTQQSRTATSQISSANRDLSSLARDLRAVVERFQIDPQPPGGDG